MGRDSPVQAVNKCFKVVKSLHKSWSRAAKSIQQFFEIFFFKEEKVQASNVENLILDIENKQTDSEIRKKEKAARRSKNETNYVTKRLKNEPVIFI